MSIDDVVDRLLAKRVINEEKNEKEETNEKNKEEQQAFRYITKEEAIEQELTIEKPSPVSIMSLSDEKSIYELEQDIFLLALGDLDKIENVIKKHESIRKNKLE